MTIYPNPETDQLNIRLSEETDVVLSIEITDTKGITVLETEPGKAENGCITLSLKTLPAGAYILKTILNNSVKQTLFIKH